MGHGRETFADESSPSEHLRRSYFERDMGGEIHRWRGAFCKLTLPRPR